MIFAAKLQFLVDFPCESHISPLRSGLYIYIYWLVVLTILKNMKVNGKDDIPYMKWKIKNVWNHQPVYIYNWYFTTLMVYIPIFGSKHTTVLYLNNYPRTVMGLRLHDALIERLWQGNVQQLQPPTWRCRHPTTWMTGWYLVAHPT